MIPAGEFISTEDLSLDFFFLVFVFHVGRNITFHGSFKIYLVETEIYKKHLVYFIKDMFFEKKMYKNDWG